MMTIGQCNKTRNDLGTFLEGNMGMLLSKQAQQKAPLLRPTKASLRPSTFSPSISHAHPSQNACALKGDSRFYQLGSHLRPWAPCPRRRASFSISACNVSRARNCHVLHRVECDKYLSEASRWRDSVAFCRPLLCPYHRGLWLERRWIVLCLQSATSLVLNPTPRTQVRHEA